MPKPLFRWVGGKQNLLPQLEKHFPKPEEVNNYFEPFAGGGSVFLSQGFERKYVSDINRELINTYRWVQKNPALVSKYLREYGEQRADKIYKKVRSEFNRKRHSDTCAQAARFIFLLQSCYNGFYRVNSRNEFNVPLGRKQPYLPTFEELLEVSLMLRNIQLECVSYESILTKARKGDFVYLDPPYPTISPRSNDNKYTSKYFVSSYHKKLFEFTNTLHKRGVKILMSYVDAENVKNELNDFDFEEIHSTWYVSCKSVKNKVKELIIKNY